MPKLPSTTSGIRVETKAGNKALTMKQAKALLGWEEETEDNKFGSDFAFRDSNKVKIRCNNNTTNRPIRWSSVLTLKQEMHNARWKLNGEPIIIGDKGSILDGQHTLISFVIAAQEVAKNPDNFMCENPLTLEKIIVKNVDEDDATVNTINTGVPRSLADVIFRSGFFPEATPADKRKLAKACEYAIRFLWTRTGAGLDAYAVKRTHAESLDFLDRHMSLITCLNHIVEENAGSDKKIERFIPLGTACGLMYVMGSSTSSPDDYFSKDEKSEKHLDFEMLDKAAEFWTLLAGGNKLMLPVAKAIAGYIEEDNGTAQIKSAVLCKAWNTYSTGKKITAATLKLEFSEDEWGYKTLLETPTVGGPDKGNPQDTSERDPSQEEIEKEAAKIKKKNIAEEKDKKPSSNKKKSTTIRKGAKVVVIHPTDEEANWQGVVDSVKGEKVYIKVDTGFAGAGTITPAIKSQVQLQ